MADTVSSGAASAARLPGSTLYGQVGTAPLAGHHGVRAIWFVGFRGGVAFAVVAFSRSVGVRPGRADRPSTSPSGCRLAPEAAAVLRRRSAGAISGRQAALTRGGRIPCTYRSPDEIVRRNSSQRATNSRRSGVLHSEAGLPLGGLRPSRRDENRASSRGRPGAIGTGPDPAGQTPAGASSATASARRGFSCARTSSAWWTQRSVSGSSGECCGQARRQECWRACHTFSRAR